MHAAERQLCGVDAYLSPAQGSTVTWAGRGWFVALIITQRITPGLSPEVQCFVDSCGVTLPMHCAARIRDVAGLGLPTKL